MTIPDAHQRQRALDPSLSFIVQAPAGSGKTELLIQRLLVLLAQVKEPEEILAITFTRKAAAEMTERIIQALQRALLEPEPQTEPARLTWQLAQKVLENDKNYHWQLLVNPHRLPIQTIDAFCASITRKMPLLTQLGPQPTIAENAYLLYQQAVRQFMATLDSEEPWAAELATILLHLDNQYHNLERLLVNMLATRDQWLPHLSNASQIKQLRQILEAELSLLVEEKLQLLQSLISTEELLELHSIMQYVQQQSHPTSLNECASPVPLFNIDYYGYWQSLSQLLLTQKFTWRKTVTVREGFPAPHKTCSAADNELRKSMKERYTHLLAKFASDEHLRQALQAISQAPTIEFSDKQWQILTALIKILKVAVGFLWLSFQEYNAVDYIEIAQRALQALGESGDPSQLALLLDYKLQHILVDEFQDTSSTQYHLLEKLTEGWEANDGRTLFLVGDPMQSIYRFRKAEVSLFLQAELYGINQVVLQKLTLSANFRSQTALVNWFNHTFSPLFPAQANRSVGAIPYTPALGMLPSSQVPAVQTHIFAEQPAAEIERIIDLIQQQLAADPRTKIAILVRARQHIAELTPALKAAKLSYRAVEIESLTEKAVIHDLLTLTRALLFLNDRIAWLAMLRAPWCGLDNDDLYQIAGLEQNCSLWERIQIPEHLNLSPTGYKQITSLLKVLKPALSHRQRKPLELWLESIWLQLGGPATIHHRSELQDAQTFFKLIRQLQLTGGISDINVLEQRLTELYATPQAEPDCRLEIMTIHKAKGLEFDVVILPSLHKESASDKSQLLLFMERTSSDNRMGLVLAPIKAFTEQSDPIYKFIQQEEQQKADYELSRLLYVAVTRAKQQLHLLAQVSIDPKLNAPKPPAKTSLLGKLWPYLQFNLICSSAPTPASLGKLNKTHLKRLIKTQLPSFSPLKLANRTSSTPGFHPTSYQTRAETLKQIGTVIHRLLYRMSQIPSPSWPLLLKEQAHWETALIQLGVVPKELGFATRTIHQALQNLIQDQRAHWLLAQPHVQAHSEYAISSVKSATGSAVKQLIIDRTFVANEIRWIIDYKTTLYSPSDLLEQQQQLHRAQLETYAQALEQIEKRPIRLGLYFPLLPEWIEWAYSE